MDVSFIKRTLLAFWSYHIAMDKQQRKNIKNQYKEERKKVEMTRMLNSEHPWIRNFAQVELGEALPPVTKETIDKAESGSELDEVLYFKIMEKVRRNNPHIKSMIYPRIDEAMNKLSEYLQIIYHTRLFEGMIAMGYIDEQFTYYNDLQKKELETFLNKLKDAYKLMDCQQMIILIERAEKTQDYDELQEISKMYDPKVVEQQHLCFIKSHWQEYILE